MALERDVAQGMQLQHCGCCTKGT